MTDPHRCPRCGRGGEELSTAGNVIGRADFWRYPICAGCRTALGTSLDDLAVILPWLAMTESRRAELFEIIVEYAKPEPDPWLEFDATEAIDDR